MYSHNVFGLKNLQEKRCLNIFFSDFDRIVTATEQQTLLVQQPTTIVASDPAAQTAFSNPRSVNCESMCVKFGVKSQIVSGFKVI